MSTLISKQTEKSLLHTDTNHHHHHHQILDRNELTKRSPSSEEFNLDNCSVAHGFFTDCPIASVRRQGAALRRTVIKKPTAFVAEDS